MPCLLLAGCGHIAFDRIYETKRAQPQDELGPPVLVTELVGMTDDSDRDPH